MAQPLGIPYSYFADSNGAPLSGGLIYTYTAGTLTPLATYTDSTLGTPLSNPVVLDSAGRATIWLSGLYKIIVKDSLGNTISTTDNISATGSGGDMTKAVYDPAGVNQQLVSLSTSQTLSNKTINQPNIVGATNGGNAAAGSVGELLESSIATGSAVSLVTATAKNVTSISLTAGDWDVFGNIGFVPAGGTTISQINGGISLNSNTLPTAPNGGAQFQLQTTFTAGGAQLVPVGMMRISISITTTVYLVVQSTFGVSTMAAYGYIGARRRR